MDIILNCLWGATAFLFVIIAVISGDYAFDLYKRKEYKIFKCQRISELVALVACFSSLAAWVAAFVCAYLIFN